MDWENQPSIYKAYPGVEPMGLPTDILLPEINLSTLLHHSPEKRDPADLTLEDLSKIFLLTYSLTAKARQSGGDFYYRSVASAGALFPSEIYVALQGLKGAEPGLYHFSIAHHALSMIRSGEVPSPFPSGSSADSSPTFTFFLTAIFFRSAWKYRNRAYRYHLLDTGHLLENLALALAALGIPFSHSLDFHDRSVNRFLGLDESREEALAVVHIPENGGWIEDRLQDIPEITDSFKGAGRVSQNEIQYEEILDIHHSGHEWSAPSLPRDHMVHALGVKPMKWTPLERESLWAESKNYTESVFHRRSKRNFIPSPVPEERLKALMTALAVDGPGRDEDVEKTLGIGVLIGRVQGFSPGFYLLDTGGPAFGPVSPGAYLEKMSRTCLDQMWLSNAALHVLFMANLEVLDCAWGARGYRHAMMTAGRLGQRLYLAATAMDLGCCGIGALYDREAADLLGLNESSRLLYLVGVGPIKQGVF